MEFRVLKYFLAVAREENITRAAALLNTTQPNLSRQMQSLEDEIGKPLFNRGSRKIVLSETGILLRKRAEEIISLYEKTETELKSNDDKISGNIYIGCGESHVIRLIAKAAKLTQISHPLIKFHLFSGDAATVNERLDKGLIDFGVFIDYDDTARYDFVRLPLTDLWGVLMRKDNALARHKNVTADDLRDLPLICSQQIIHNNRHVLSNWFSQGNVMPHIAATYNLIYNASLLVEEGLGCAIGLDKLINTGGNAALCFRPLSPRLESHLDIAWKKYQVFSHAAEIFFENLQTLL